MLSYLLVILIGYYAIASLRSSVNAINAGSDYCLTEWLMEHPYHFVFKIVDDNDSVLIGVIVGVIGGIIALISWIISIAMLCADASHFALPLFWGTCLYSLVAFAYWLHVKNYFQKWQLSRLWQKAKNWWQSRVPEETREAKSIEKKLKNIPKKEFDKKLLAPLLENVKKVVEEELPRLIAYRVELEGLIKICQAAIQEEKDNGIVKGEEPLMKQSENDLKKLENRLIAVKDQIALTLSSLRHLINRFCTLVGLESNEEIQQELNQVHNVINDLLTARERIQSDFTEPENPANLLADLPSEPETHNSPTTVVVMQK